MLGHPALVAGHRRGDAQRVALLAEQGVAAVARAVAPDRAVSGKWAMYLVSLHGHATSAWPSVERGADRVQALDEAGVRAPRWRRSTGVPMRAMILHRDDDVGGVGDLDAEHRHVGLDVAHDERDDVHRATGHAAPVEVGHQAPSSRPATIQLFVKPASFSSLGADEGAVLDARDVARVGGRVEASSASCRVEPGEGAGRRRAASVSRSHSSSEPSTQWIASRGGQRGDLVDPGLQACVTRARRVLRLRGHGGPSAGLAQLVGHPRACLARPLVTVARHPPAGSLVSTVGPSTEG